MLLQLLFVIATPIIGEPMMENGGPPPLHLDETDSRSNRNSYNADDEIIEAHVSLTTMDNVVVESSQLEHSPHSHPPPHHEDENCDACGLVALFLLLFIEGSIIVW